MKIERTSRRHQPKGLPILHEDRDIIVVEKPAGLLTVGTDRIKEDTAYYRLTDYVRKGNSKSRDRIFVVHRLDRDASGVLVFARTPEAKEKLQGEWDAVKKSYVAVVHGTPSEPSGTIESYLTENRAKVVHSTDDARIGKWSRTAYRVLKSSNAYSLLEIDLLTGRKHQIRVHLAEAGNPIVGDKKYGGDVKGEGRLALHARSIAFNHPFSGARLTFETTVPEHFALLMERRIAAKPVVPFVVPGRHPEKHRKGKSGRRDGAKTGKLEHRPAASARNPESRTAPKPRNPKPVAELPAVAPRPIDPEWFSGEEEPRSARAAIGRGKPARAGEKQVGRAVGSVLRSREENARSGVVNSQPDKPMEAHSSKRPDRSSSLDVRRDKSERPVARATRPPRGADEKTILRSREENTKSGGAESEQRGSTKYGKNRASRPSESRIVQGVRAGKSGKRSDKKDGKTGHPILRSREDNDRPADAGSSSENVIRPFRKDDLKAKRSGSKKGLSGPKRVTRKKRR